MNPDDSGSLMRIMGKLAKTKISGVALQKLEQLAAKMGVDEKELFQLYVKVKNTASRQSFAATPYSERILLLPQCLRSRDCQAGLGEYGYECQGCGRCDIKRIIAQAKKLGYRHVYIMPCGSIARKIFAKEKPKACLGVACLKELMLGSFVCEKLGVIGQGIALLRDGCVNTCVDWKAVSSALHLRLKPPS
jgi:hypothetical protein